MSKNSIFSYFFDGFSLANKSFVIYIILLLFSLPTLVQASFPNSLISQLLPFLSLTITIFALGFRLSMPLFLLEKQANKPLNISDMAKSTLKNIRRMMLPSILLFIFVGVLAIAALVVSVILVKPTKEQIPELIQGFINQSQGWHPIFLIPSLVFSFLAFTSIFFSLENQGLFSAIRNSIFTSFKNLPYITLVITAGIISYSVTSFLPTEFWGLLVRFVTGTYISLVVSASTLYFYQRNLKKIQ